MSDIKRGLNSITDLKRGSTNINYVYRGTNLVWSRSVTPTPTPTITPTSTITPTPTPTITPTPTVTPTIQTTYITNVAQIGNNSTVTFNNVNIGGPGLIVVAINAKGGFNINSATINGSSVGVNKISTSNQTDASVAGFIWLRITANITTANISIVFGLTTNAVNIATYRITNNISDSYISNNSINWTTFSSGSRSMTIPLAASSNKKTIITTVTETGLTGPSGQNITFTSSPSTTRNYYQQASNTPTPYYVAAGGLTTLTTSVTSFNISASFTGGSNKGSMIGIVFN